MTDRLRTFLQNSKLFIKRYWKVYREIVSFSSDQLIEIYQNTKLTQVALFLLLVFLVAVILEAYINRQYFITFILIFFFLIVVNITNRLLK